MRYHILCNILKLCVISHILPYLILLLYKQLYQKCLNFNNYETNARYNNSTYTVIISIFNSHLLPSSNFIKPSPSDDSPPVCRLKLGKEETEVAPQAHQVSFTLSGDKEVGTWQCSIRSRDGYWSDMNGIIHLTPPVPPCHIHANGLIRMRVTICWSKWPHGSN